MSALLFLVIFFSFLALYISIGLFVSRRLKTATDYFLASKDIGFFPLVMTLMATQVGGGSLLGTAEEAYRQGFYGILYSIGIAVGFLLLGLGFASLMHRCGVGTTAEIFQTHYGLPFLRKFASFLSIITMSGILIAQIVGAKKLLMSIGFFSEPLFLICWMLIVMYTMLGGLQAVVLTDMVQILFIIIAFGLFFLYMTPTYFQMLFVAKVPFAIFDTVDTSFNALFGVVAMPALFALIEQDLAQRFFAARTGTIARYSALVASVGILFFAFIPLLCGIHARMLGLDIASGASPLMPYMQMFTTPFFAVCIACAVIAAITSTADSLLCAISSNLYHDFDFSFLSHSVIVRSRLVTIMVGIVLFFASRFVGFNIIHILIASYELSVCCLLVPLLAAYFQWRPNQRAAQLSVLGGLISFFILRFISLPVPKELLSLLISYAGFVIGYLLTEFKKSSV